MRTKWVFLILASIAAVTILAACGGDDDDNGGDSNPGGFTAEEAGIRVSELLEASGCRTTERYSNIEAKDGKWELRAGIGLVSFVWTYDPVTNTVTEATGRCQAN